MPTFDEAVIALLDMIERGEGTFYGLELEVIMQGLGRLVGSRFSSLTREDVVDAVNEALARFIAAAREGKVDRSRNPAAYLTAIALNFAIELRRRQRAEQLAEPEEIERAAGGEDPLQDFIQLLSDRQTILELMRRARDSGQHELNDLIRCWRDLVSVGETPTLRELGICLGISHTEVRRRLDRLAKLRQ
jgi:DNA-directed RNA polymerase specialized sigma24 family protein